MKALIGYSLFFITFLLACTQPPDYPVEPVLEFNSLSSPSMQQGSQLIDTVYMTFNFTDGDGDIGNLDDSLDVFLIDPRFPDGTNVNTFRLPYVPPQGTGNGISGEISVQLPPTCCTYPAGVALPCTPNVAQYPTDSVAYEVYIYDRAGNESNHIFSSPLTIICQ